MAQKLKNTLHIDGSRGEGGGQILRTSLSLARSVGGGSNPTAKPPWQLQVNRFALSTSVKDAKSLD